MVMERLADGHSHLHELGPDFIRDFAPDLQAAVCGTSSDDWDRVEAFCHAAPPGKLLVPHLGVHPWWAGTADSAVLEDLAERLRRNARTQLGEVGLDKCAKGLERSDLETQTEIFTRQLRIAAELNRVASIHCVRAFDEAVECIERGGAQNCSMVFHAFSPSTSRVLQQLLRYPNAYLSIGGHFRFKKQKALLRQIPHDRLLMETDCPSMRPSLEELQSCSAAIAAFQDTSRNEPACLFWIAERLADVVPDPLALCASNFDRLYGCAGARGETRRLE